MTGFGNDISLDLNVLVSFFFLVERMGKDEIKAVSCGGICEFKIHSGTLA